MTKATNVVPNDDRDIIVTRVFDAAPGRIFEAHTSPELLESWLKGPDGWSLAVTEYDVRPGGRFRQQWTSADGQSFAMVGEFREVERPHRLARTELFEGCDLESGTFVTAAFEPLGEATLLTTTISYPSREARDGALESNMAAGISASYAWLDALLAEPARLAA